MPMTSLLKAGFGGFIIMEVDGGKLAWNVQLTGTSVRLKYRCYTHSEFLKQKLQEKQLVPTLLFFRKSSKPRKMRRQC